MSSSSPLITIRGLRKKYRGSEALHGIDLDIPQGKVTAFLGPNGAGKTTAIKCTLNLLERGDGEINVLGKDPRDLGPQDWKQIGYASENQPYPRGMNLSQWLGYLRPMYGTCWDDGLEKTLLEQFAVPTDVPLKSLSRGQRMKALLLGSLAYRPKLVVLDEPFAGIDPLARDEILGGLLELSETENWTVWISSHDIEDIQRFADRVIFLKDGTVELQEEVEPLIGRHRTIDVVFDDPPAAPPDLPPSWRRMAATGRTLRFIETDYDESRSRTDATAILPPFNRMEIHPMNLREIFIATSKTPSPSRVP
jgi:ABC-2 type transport system ATP-binding protein